MNEPIDRRKGRLNRLWWSLTNPGRLDRFNRWRMSPATVTRGFLAFRDIVIVGFCAAIVLTGVTTVRGLRRDDCDNANARRLELHDVALNLLDNDRFLIDLADSLSDQGLPAEFEEPLDQRYEDMQRRIDEAYRPVPCG